MEVHWKVAGAVIVLIVILIAVIKNQNDKIVLLTVGASPSPKKGRVAPAGVDEFDD